MAWTHIGQPQHDAGGRSCVVAGAGPRSSFACERPDVYHRIAVRSGAGLWTATLRGLVSPGVTRGSIEQSPPSTTRSSRGRSARSPRRVSTTPPGTPRSTRPSVPSSRPRPRDRARFAAPAHSDHPDVAQVGYDAVCPIGHELRLQQRLLAKPSTSVWSCSYEQPHAGF